MTTTDETPKWRPETEAEAERARAEAEKFAAEARKANAEAEAAEHEAVVARLEREKVEEKRRRELLADDYGHHVYAYYGAVDKANVDKCIAQLKQWHREDPECDIEVVFFSPGGGVFVGMELYDFLKFLSKTHEVTTTGSGMAASMGGILLQAGTVRTMTRESYVMIHEIATVTSGKTSEIEDEVEFLKKMTARVVDIFVSRAQATGRPKALTKAKLRRLMTRKDAWLSSDECYELGVVDEVR